MATNSVFARNQQFWGKITVLPKIVTISTNLAISNNMSSFVPKYWLNWQFWWLFLMNVAEKDGTIKV